MLTDIKKKLAHFAKLVNGRYIEDGFYPGWQFKKESRVREIFVKSFKDLFNKDAEVEVIHAGLECGNFAGKISDLDVISFGPDLYNLHTPEERLSISSTRRTYKLLLEVVDRYSKL